MSKFQNTKRIKAIQDDFEKKFWQVIRDCKKLDWDSVINYREKKKNKPSEYLKPKLPPLEIVGWSGV